MSYVNKKKSKSNKFSHIDHLKKDSGKEDSDNIPLKELQQFQDNVCLDLKGEGVIFFFCNFKF